MLFLGGLRSDQKCTRMVGKRVQDKWQALSLEATGQPVVATLTSP